MKKIVILSIVLITFLISIFFIYNKYNQNESENLNIIDCSIQKNKQRKECLYFGDSKIIINEDGVISTYVKKSKLF